MFERLINEEFWGVIEHMQLFIELQQDNKATIIKLECYLNIWIIQLTLHERLNAEDISSC